MIRRTLSIHSRGIASTRSHNRGFSLVEVMMTVVLLALGMALALPSYRDMVEKRQVTNGAEQLASFINAAQGVAMKTNQVVTVSYDRNDDDDWCVGATVGATACNCSQTNTESADYCEIATQPFILNNAHAGDRDLVAAMGESDSGSYSFDPIRGFAPGLTEDLTVELRSPGDDFRLNLVVNRTGRVILCSNDDAHAVPGYGPCPADPVETVPEGS